MNKREERLTTSAISMVVLSYIVKIWEVMDFGVLNESRDIRVRIAI